MAYRSGVAMIKWRVVCLALFQCAFGDAAIALEPCADLMKKSGSYIEQLDPIDDPPTDPTPTERFYFYSNRDAGDMHGVERLTKLLNVSGKGSFVGVWDVSAVFGNHEQLKGRVKAQKADCEKIEGTSCVGRHATHVAGTIASEGKPSSGDKGESSRGMAPEATVYSFQRHDYFRIAREVCKRATDVQPSYISNHSYGRHMGWDYECGVSNGVHITRWSWQGKGGMYDDDPGASVFDDLVYKYPTLSIFKSAGNYRGKDLQLPLCGTTTMDNDEYFIAGQPVSKSVLLSQGYQLPPTADYYNITSLALAKNVITIGAIEKNPESVAKGKQGPGLQDKTDVKPTGFSSFGPRGNAGGVKPDLVAAGRNLLSPAIDLFERRIDDPKLASLTNHYESLEGTSMASPTAVGRG